MDKATKEDETANNEKLDEALKLAQSQFKQLKKRLKIHSKSELIALIAKYASDAEELRHIAKLLLEENKQLKGETK